MTVKVCMYYVINNTPQMEYKSLMVTQTKKKKYGRMEKLIKIFLFQRVIKPRMFPTESTFSEDTTVSSWLIKILQQPHQLLQLPRPLPLKQQQQQNQEQKKVLDLMKRTRQQQTRV